MLHTYAYSCSQLCRLWPQGLRARPAKAFSISFGGSGNSSLTNAADDKESKTVPECQSRDSISYPRRLNLRRRPIIASNGCEKERSTMDYSGAQARRVQYLFGSSEKSRKRYGIGLQWCLIAVVIQIEALYEDAF